MNDPHDITRIEPIADAFEDAEPPEATSPVNEILAIAAELDCGPPETALTFARAIAERCINVIEAQLGPAAAAPIAETIRAHFPDPDLDDPDEAPSRDR